jgi:non-ribosomal peptide synthetase component F
MIIGLLAILKSGKAYLPLDPDHPPARLKQMIHEAGITVCICKDDERDFFSLLQTGMELLASDVLYPTSSLQGSGHSELVYLLFTSGSTGIPKGVCMTQSSMTNLL